ncbi:uncharacterized protein TRIADDRAFT_57265 [Trichoplax adhaerens]|uniref:Complement component 1 Q subcomponent-binding protein, mitochondrial n=1 Tax=Trichoplax adhaerens TaxID=10228 RepID=B3RYY9_TRIAD|nr:hypothetical protein TRIADDRAFT_57265 [Trichoplax adhaerens]EDV23752.1 hypothetical protein TRIADDRAFT_57265 [Trichoplax adhaerens]|eukprot:XP_002113278.1 hypothetical protein TRIADDRAFT_57265 [Trichoplax adhaerens]
MSKILQVMSSRLLYSTVQRSFTRSFHVSSSVASKYLRSSLLDNSTSVFRLPPQAQNYQFLPRRLLASQSDVQAVDYFNREIELESQALSNLPTIKNFKCEIQGTRATFCRELNNESITVTMDINDNVESNIPEFDPDENVDEDDIDGGDRIFIHCSIDTESTPDTPFSLNEIYVLPNGVDEKNAYCTRAENQDSEFYEVIYNSLRDRGIDHNFGQQLKDFCDVLEHSEYYKFLQTVRDFFKAE